MPRTNSFIHALRVVTEDAALAAFDWVGRGEKELGDGAAVDAMRAALAAIPVSGEVVIGEGEKDEAPHLYRGERFGCGEGEPEYDIAVDPVEGTTFLAQGMAGSMAVIALAPRGTMFDPGPAFYMEKVALPPAARGQIDPTWSPAKIVQKVAECLNKPVEDVTVFVLNKPRHAKLVKSLRACGARVSLQSAGDVAGALLAGIRGTPIDILMGTGGTPEGVLVAGAMKALGGDMFARIDPQRPDEKQAALDFGLDLDKWLTLDELTSSTETLFCASGITSGLLCNGVDRDSRRTCIQTVLISGLTRERQLLTTWRPRSV